MTHMQMSNIISTLKNNLIKLIYLLNFNFFRRIPNVETYTLSGLYPDTLYYIWLAARSQRGEGATTPPIPVRTKQYGKKCNDFIKSLIHRLKRKRRFLQDTVESMLN